VPSPLVITVAVTGLLLLFQPLIAPATSAKLFKSGVIVTDPTLAPPTLTLIVWPWVNSSLAEFRGSKTVLVLDDEGSTPAETNPQRSQSRSGFRRRDPGHRLRCEACRQPQPRVVNGTDQSRDRIRGICTGTHRN